MTAENDTTLRAADAVFAAEQAVSRARWVVEELHETISSALGVLNDAELNSAKARLSDRGWFYVEAAGEHLGRLRNRCRDMPELTRKLFRHLNRATESVTDARALLELADTSDPVVAAEVAQFKPRIAVVGEMVALAKPVAQLATQHVESAHTAAGQATPASLLEPVTLERSIATAGKELNRADDDVRLLSDVVDHAAASARESTGIATEIDNARRRMAEHGRDPVSHARPGDHRSSPVGREEPNGPRPGWPTVGGPRPPRRRPRRARPGRRPDRTTGRRPAAVSGDRPGRPGRPDHARGPSDRPCRGLRAGHQRRHPMFGTTPEAILSAERSRPVSDARAVAMTASREVGLSVPAIAENFNKDHGSVIHAVRRTGERPRLADAAARVAEHVNDRYTARLPRPAARVASLHQETPTSTFAPDGPVEHAVVAAADAFGTTPEILLGADWSRAAADARAVAMTAARIREHSLPTIARHFDRDHTTVLHATRRIEKTSRLRGLAAKIAAELPDEPGGAGTRQADVEQIPDTGSRSPGARAQERAVPIAGERPQLKVAR